MKLVIRLGLMMVMALMAHGLRADDNAAKGKAVATPPVAQSTLSPKVKHPTAKASRKTATVKKKKAEASAAETDQYVWVCPMGDFTGTKPGKCPNCGMDLVKVKKSDSKKQ